MTSPHYSRGYTLIELIVSVGLFAIIMTLVTGAYLVMIGVNRHTQAVSIGIDNLAFALETMTRTIRTGTDYVCGSGDCTTGGTTLRVVNEGEVPVTYTLSGGAITQAKGGPGVELTDPSVNVTSLTFYAYGTSSGDDVQPRVVITIAGTVSAGANKEVPFNVETSAAMRGSDI